LKKYIKIDDRFSLSADKFNIILKDNERFTNNGYSYHSNVNDVVNHITYAMEKDAVLVGQPISSNKDLRIGDLYLTLTRLKHDITLLIEKKLKKLKKDLQ
jgi:hypothetical protein